MNPHSPPAEMRPPRFLAAAREQLRRPSVQSRISSAKSLLSQTKDYLQSKDYKGTYDSVSSRVKGAVETAKEYAGQLTREEGAEVQTWVVQKRQTWDEWAKDRRRRRADEQRGTERVWLFPGWAIRRLADPKKHAGPFELELKVSGYCTSLRPPEQASRAQRAFMRLARSFSSLPKLPSSSPSGSGSETGSLRSFTSDSNPPSVPGTPLMSPLLRAALTESPAEEIDLINLDSPTSGASTPKETSMPGYFGSNYNSSPLPSPSTEPLQLDFPTPKAPEPAPASAPRRNLSAHAFPAISLSAPTPSPPIEGYVPPPIPPRPSPLSMNMVTPIRANPQPKSPSAPSSPSLGPTRVPSSPSFGPTRRSTALSMTSTSPTDISPEELRTLHANLDSRLQPFWASALGMRRIRLTISLPPPPSPPPHGIQHLPQGMQNLHAALHPPSPSSVLASLDRPAGPIPLLTTETTTTAQGYFEERIVIPWDKLSAALRRAGGDLSRLANVEVRAEVIPLPTIAIAGTGASTNPSTSETIRSTAPLPEVHPTEISAPMLYPIPPPPSLRVISDIDDTVKHTAVLQGAKQVFHNVFVRHLDELVLDGVGDWYREMESWGVGFHYVSNSPYELLPVIREFFGVAGLPHGSIKLKYYSSSAVFHGLWDSAAERKRAGVVEVLDAFPQAKFILIGDTGEQDMELYVALARERPDQIVAIFLRDVTPPAWTADLSETSSLSDGAAEPRRPFRRSLSGLSISASAASLSASLPVGGSPSPFPGDASPIRRSTHPIPVSPPSPAAQPTRQSPVMPSSVAYLSPASATAPAPAQQPKAAEAWRTRLAAAKKAVPGHVLFKVFRKVEECGEWTGLVEKYAGGL